MRIAQVAPLYESVPPATYGGTERIVSYLTEALVDLGHEVTLFASGDSVTRARLCAGSPEALWKDPNCRETLPHHARQMSQVFDEITRFDVIHFHTDYIHFPMLRQQPWPNITTVHGALYAPDMGPLLELHRQEPLVSISESQRRSIPDANWIATVYHGMPRELLGLHPEGGDYLAFVGRVAPEKGVDRAIEIALHVGMPLKIAARIPPPHRDYYLEQIEPMLKRAGRSIEFLGELGGPDKEDLLGGARALLFPIDWEEPFGLVLIESLACGTPVIGWRRGSVPELIEPGVTGFIVSSLDEAARAVDRVGTLDRATCRRAFEDRFDAVRMTREYVDVYRQVADAHHGRHAESRLRVAASA